MIPNGKEIIVDGHKVVFESTTYQCRGCFFENRDSCPDCDEGIWVEDNPSPWHTGTPTEEGLYWVFVPQGKKKYTSDCFDGNSFVENGNIVVAWIPITPFEAEASKEITKQRESEANTCCKCSFFQKETRICLMFGSWTEENGFCYRFEDSKE